jgi:hypothetical protein
MDVVAHADLVAVIDHRRARHRQQQGVHQLDAAAVALEQRREAPADAEIDPRAPICRVGLPQIVALRVRYHFERQLVVIAQEDRPLAVVGNLRRLAHDVGDRETVLARECHVHARHQRKVERHVAFVALTEIVLGVFRPLVRFGEQHAARIGLVELGADALEHRMGFGKVLVVGAFAFDQIRDRIEPQPIDAEIEPEAHHAEHGVDHLRIVEVEIGLMRIEAVPVIGLRDRIPGPVRALGIEEDDARAGIFLVVVGPDIEIARRRAGLGPPRALEPRMLVGGVIDHELGDDADAARVRRRDEALDVGHRAVIGMHRAVFADVVAVVEPRRWIER